MKWIKVYWFVIQFYRGKRKLNKQIPDAEKFHCIIDVHTYSGAERKLTAERKAGVFNKATLKFKPYKSIRDLLTDKNATIQFTTLEKFKDCLITVF